MYRATVSHESPEVGILNQLQQVLPLYIYNEANIAYFFQTLNYFASRPAGNVRKLFPLILANSRGTEAVLRERPLSSGRKPANGYGHLIRNVLGPNPWPWVE